MEEQKEAKGWQIANFEWFRNPPDYVAAFCYIVAFIMLLFGIYVSIGGLWQIGLAAWGNPLDDAKPDEAFRNLLLGFAGLVGAPFLVWRTLIAEQQKNIQKENHYTDLYTKAVEGLGAVKNAKDEDGKDIVVPNLEVRIGSINSLARIARESEKDHWPIMETLCAYVRENKKYDLDVAISQISKLSNIFEYDKNNLRFNFNINSCFIDNRRFFNLNFYKILFSDSAIFNISFYKSSFISSNFISTKIENSYFSSCKFRDTLFLYDIRENHFKETTFEECEFESFFHKNKFEKVSMKKCSFKGSNVIEKKQFENILMDNFTRKSFEAALAASEKNSENETSNEE